MAAKEQVRGSRPRVHEETVRRMERATGTLGTAAIAAMDERLPWFRNMSAENRSWLGLVAQAASPRSSTGSGTRNVTGRR